MPQQVKKSITLTFIENLLLGFDLHLNLRETPVKSYPIFDRNYYFNEVGEEKKVEVEEKNR
jgi:hypothetical protein